MGNRVVRTRCLVVADHAISLRGSSTRLESLQASSTTLKPYDLFYNYNRIDDAYYDHCDNDDNDDTDDEEKSLRS